jgi:hypothetical protein
MNGDGKKSDELKSLRQKLNDTENELEKIKNQIKIIKDIYGEGIVDIPEFDGKKILKNYLINVFGVNQRSKKDRATFDYIHPDENIKNPPIYMDHILFHFMRQDVSSLITILTYELENNPRDLNSSYERSAKHAEDLTDCKESLAWFINLKIPSTYRDSQSVLRNQKTIFKILEKKQKVDARRIHLFYGDFFGHSEVLYKEQLRTLFTTLLLEFFHGIESRVLFVKNIDELQNVMFEIGDNFKDNPVFLLDFALYFSKHQNSDPINVHQRIPVTHLGGIAHVLCSDFVAEIPNFQRLYDQTHGTLNAEEQMKMTKAYEIDKVYDFDNPLVYPIFKNYFLSLWNRNQYITFLDSIIKEHQKKCNCLDKNKCSFEDLIIIKNTFEKNIEILDLLNFWKLCKDHMDMKEAINFDMFTPRYFEGQDVINGLSRGFARNTISEIIPNFIFSDSDEQTWIHLDRILSNFQLRKLHRFI